MHTATAECSEQGNSELSARREIPLRGIENIPKKFLALSLVCPVAGHAHSCVFLLLGWSHKKVFSPFCYNIWPKRHLLTWTSECPAFGQPGFCRALLTHPHRASGSCSHRDQHNSCSMSPARCMHASHAADIKF